MDISEILNLLRSRLDMNNEQICKLAGINYSTLWRWDNCKSRPTKNRKAKLLAALANA